MPKIKNKIINLLPSDDFESSTFGRILKWALSTFRVMVIATELIVMGAFLSRFWLDAKNSDLNEILNVSKSQIKAYSKVESDFRLVQKQLEIAKNLYLDQNHSKAISSISSNVSENIVLNSITFNEDGVQIKASSLSEPEIAQFIANLESLGWLTNVTLSQISSGQDGGLAFVFGISAKTNFTNLRKK
jgi:Tfp pilus assembly protein PilN